MPKQKTDVILPKVLSELIPSSLRDMKKCEKSKRYKLDMDVWYTPNLYEYGVCSLCQAGAVMAQTLGDGTGPLSPGCFPGNKNQLTAINDLRMGQASHAYWRINPETSYAKIGKIERLDRPIPDYHENPKAFYSEMQKFARDLKKAGL